MIDYGADIAILGSGFGGSLAALVLARTGRSVVVIDRGCHPRFAIGESSTPAADFILRDLVATYDLPELQPFTCYGEWRRRHPEIRRGLKRGFSYFAQVAGAPFAADPVHANELLVAASADNEHSDTHWFRADVDAHFASLVRAAGVPLLEETDVLPAREPGGWRLSGTCRGEPVRITAGFLIDATGEAGVVARTLGIPVTADGFQTNSRAIFAHFANVTPWQDLYTRGGGDPAAHPYCCDDAAVHHVMDEGWMWQLRFDHGVVSAGFAIAGEGPPPSAGATPEREWRMLLERYPAIGEQFRQASIVDPPGRLIRAGRLQRRAARAAGDDFALLPHTAGFVDPLHSTGIAHTLCGIDRLAGMFSRSPVPLPSPDDLAGYDRTVQQELTLIDAIVGLCYRARRCFPLFAASSMLYFAAATTFERRRRDGTSPRGGAFLCADDPVYRRIVSEAVPQVETLLASGRQPPAAEIRRFERWLAEQIAPYNVVGLFDPEAANMYRYTAAR